MLESTTTARLVLTTVVSSQEAARMGRTLVEERLAGCATVIPTIHSIYRWQDQIEDTSEAMLLLKTETACLTALSDRLHQLHGYQIPEFLVLPVDAGSHDYLNWLHNCLG